MSKRLFFLAMLMAVFAASVFVGRAFASLPYTREQASNKHCNGAADTEYMTTWLYNETGGTVRYRRYWIEEQNIFHDLGDPAQGWPLFNNSSVAISLIKEWPTDIQAEGFEVNVNDPNLYIGAWSNFCGY